MTAIAISRQYPCVVLSNRYCSLFKETVSCLSIALSEENSTVIDVAAFPSDGLYISPVFRLNATRHAEQLGVSLYLEEVL